MKAPTAYLLDAREPDPKTHPPGYVPQAQAERAIAQVLLDAAAEKEKYAYLLVRALRRPELTHFTAKP